MAVKALLIVVLLVSTGCATGQSVEANLDRCQRTFDVRFQSGQISRLDRARGFRECNLAAFPDSPFAREYWDYFVYMAAEHEAGRVSYEHASVLINQKEAEINARRMAAIQSLQQSQPQPYPPPLPSCRSLPPGLAGYAAAQGRCY